MRQKMSVVCKNSPPWKGGVDSAAGRRRGGITPLALANSPLNPMFFSFTP